MSIRQPFTLLTLPCVISVLISNTAFASEPPPSLFGRTVKNLEQPSEEELARRASAFQRMLEETGQVQMGDQVFSKDLLEAAPVTPQTQSESLVAPTHRATVFLNFWGETLTNGNNSALNKSPCVTGTINYPGFNGTEQTALALIQVFETRMSPYGIRIAYDKRPPAHLPYAMVMMGGTPDLLGMDKNVLGVSCSSDCGDKWWRDLTFSFTANAGNNATQLGLIALHEAAHAFGLAHIKGTKHIMYPFSIGGDAQWAQDCTAYDEATGGINCKNVHESFCDGNDEQNTHAELLAFFGTNSVDDIPPTVEIIQPEVDLVELPEGGKVVIEADISDNFEGYGWRLVIEKDGEILQENPETNQNAVKIWSPSFDKEKNKGIYKIRVEAIDHDRNVGFDEVTLHVGDVDPLEGESDSEGGSDSEGDDSSGSDGSDSDDTSELPTDSGTGGDSETLCAEDSTDENCADDAQGCGSCQVTGPGIAGHLSGFLALFGLSAIRRRRINKTL